MLNGGDLHLNALVKQGKVPLKIPKRQNDPCWFCQKTGVIAEQRLPIIPVSLHKHV